MPAGIIVDSPLRPNDSSLVGGQFPVGKRIDWYNVMPFSVNPYTSLKQFVRSDEYLYANTFILSVPFWTGAINLQNRKNLILRADAE